MVSKRTIRIGQQSLGADQPLFLIAGPCVLEDPDEMLGVAEALVETCDEAGVGFCFKSSYTKDNRTSGQSYRGPGLEEGLRLLRRISRETGAPIVTDVHHPEEAEAVANVAEVLQIPAFLCRQTSLLEAVGMTGQVVNVKKGQFLAAADMAHAASKLEGVGCRRILFTERGSFFGYRDLTVDFRSIQIMGDLGYPVVFDATHSVQSPGSTGTTTGGSPELIPLLARCGVAAGCDAIFLEVHPEPSRAKSDAGCQLPLAKFQSLLQELVSYRELYLEIQSRGIST
ncbi:MAG: 3-deoxy-8-phosphooctulonate synthase [Gemmatimonadales bacterium]|nr:3-deoxy-8-phosphooctulonate synthase [Gemmatimonadales bacterium]